MASIRWLPHLPGFGTGPGHGQAGRRGSFARRIAAWLVLLGGLLYGLPAQVQVSGQPSCPPSRVAGGHDYQGLVLVSCSFNGLDLRKANFSGAQLTGVVFVRANLAGAEFSNATFLDSGSATFPTDFSFADLTDAKFVGAKFNGTTYLTYATLVCADFSSVNLTTGTAIFGDQALNIDTPRDCRTKFQNATMNCEFVAQWGKLDLSGADISACASVLLLANVNGAGHDFSGGIYSGVVFDNLDLTGSKWNGAVLERASFQGATLDNATGLNGAGPLALSKLSAAKFNNASVQNVDLSYAALYGAQFTNANLSNSSFAGSFLQANTGATPPIETAAVFDGAHLRNVSFAAAQLQSVKFRFASLYGTYGGDKPRFPCQAANSNRSCATASGADLTGADFSNAYLYGVDFGGPTTINGTNFGSAILAGANFASAKFQVNGGAAPDFTKALLQGANFDADANLVGTVLLNAFVDFGKASNPNSFNIVYLQLTTDYTGFRGWTGSSRPCVQLTYGSFTAVPPNASMTCPNSHSTVCGAGNTPASLVNWKSAIAMANNAVPGWYPFDATYDAAAATSAICNNNATVDPKW